MQIFNRLETKTFRRRLRRNLTKEERKIWNLVRNRKILSLKFFRQYSIGKFTVDFYCPEIKLVMEIDGGQHSQSKTDEIRTKYLNSLGISMIRFWNNEINENLEGVYLKLYEICQKLKELTPSLSLIKRGGRNHG